MPTVPVLQESGPMLQDIAPQGAPNVRVNGTGGTHAPVKVIDTFNIDQQNKLASGAMGLGNELLRQQVDAQNQANQVRINDAMNKAMEAKLRLTYDKTDGYVNLQGDAALTRPDGQSLSEEYGTKFDQQISDIASGLGNDTQRREFMNSANQMAVQFKGGIQQHVAREYGQYQLSTQDGTVKTAQQQMGLAWGDADALTQSKNAIQAAVYETGRLKGWSGEQTQAAMVEQLSVGHTSVLSAAIDAGNLDYAKEYLKQHNDELTPEARLQATKVLNTGMFEAKTQKAATDLYSGSNGDTASALAAARSQYTGKEQDAIVTRIKGFDAERVTLRERGQKDAADTAWKTYAQTKSLNQISPTTWAAMDGRDIESLRRTAQADYDAAHQQKEVKTDPNVYYTLSAAANQDPNFKSQDLRPFFDRLSPSDRAHFIDIQTKTQKPEQLAQVVAVGEQKSAITRGLAMSERDAGVFNQVADKALYAAQMDKGAVLNQDERQKVLDKLVLRGAVPGNWFGTNQEPLYKAINEGHAAQFAPSYSDADIRKATAALQRQGIVKPTQQQVTQTLNTAYGIK